MFRIIGWSILSALIANRIEAVSYISNRQFAQIKMPPDSRRANPPGLESADESGVPPAFLRKGRPKTFSAGANNEKTKKSGDSKSHAPGTAK